MADGSDLFGTYPPDVDSDGEVTLPVDQLQVVDSPKTFRFEIVMPSAIAGQEHVLQQVDMVINPQEYQVHEPTRQAVTQTTSGAWVDYYGLGLPKITIAGTTGFAPFATRDKFGKPTGLKDFLDLRNRIFRLYANLLQKNKWDFTKRIQNQIQLRFYSWDTGDYYIVLVDDFVLKRSAQRPLMFDYQIVMQVIGYIHSQSPVTDDVLQGWKNFDDRRDSIVTAIKARVSELDKFRQDVKNFIAPVAKALSDINKTATQVADAVATGAEYVSTVTVGLIKSLSYQIIQLDQTVQGVQGMAVDFRNGLVNSLHGLMCGLQGLVTAGVYEKTWQNLTDGTPWAHLNCSSTMVVPVAPQQFIQQAQGVVSRAPSSTYTTIESPVQVGDTLDIILQRENVPTEIIATWQELATANNLEYPYIVKDINFQKNVAARIQLTFYGTQFALVPAGSLFATPATATRPAVAFRTETTVSINSDGMVTVWAVCTVTGTFGNVEANSVTVIVNAISGLDAVTNLSQAVQGKTWRVLVPGDKIRLPKLNDQKAGTMFKDMTDVVSWNLFGIDLALDSDGELAADATGDLGVVAGLDNVIAAITDRVQAETGELIKHPEYGMPLSRIIGRGGDSNRITVAELEVSRSISADPRVKSINKISLNFNSANTALYVNINANLIDESSATVNAEASS